MPTILPPYIEQAFDAVYGAAADEEKYEAFASRWGGLDEASLWRAFEQGSGEERLVAIFALGYQQTPAAREALAPLLASPLKKERWASALCLAAAKDERALPSLKTMLLEGLSLDKKTWPRKREECWEDSWHDSHRIGIPSLLAAWQDASVIPLMRQAFQRVWDLELVGYPHLFSNHYQDALSFALGQRGAFGFLTGLDVPTSHRKTAMIYLALGDLQTTDARFHNQRWWDLSGHMMADDEFIEEVARVLERLFGLSREEQEDITRNYYDNSGLRFSSRKRIKFVKRVKKWRERTRRMSKGRTKVGP